MEGAWEDLLGTTSGEVTGPSGHSRGQTSRTRWTTGEASSSCHHFKLERCKGLNSVGSDCWTLSCLPTGNDSPGFEACQHFFGF